MERISLSSEREPSVTIPLYHESVLSCQPQERIYDAVRARIELDSKHIDRFLGDLLPWLHCGELAAVPRLPANEIDPFWDNGWFGLADARVLYAVIRQYRPRRLLEVGSGNSTKFASKAIRDGNTATELVTIDPQPRCGVGGIAHRWLERNIWQVSVDEFRGLEPGDVLFVDGSHIVLNGSDVVRFFLEILPMLKPGVLVHMHDIHLPYEYSAEFDNRGYAEQYMLATALLYSRELIVLLPVSYLVRTGRIKEGGGSFWFTKRE